VVHAPAGFDPRRPIRLVVFLHGYRGCAAVLAAEGPTRCRAGDPPQPGWGLAARHDEAGTGSLFVVAQLALSARDGSPGRFGREGGFRTFLDEVLAQLSHELGGPRTVADLASITLLAHSAAFESALAVLRSGGVDDVLRHVVLLDALYSGGPAFLAWARGAPGRRLVSVHLGRGTTGERNRDLAARAARALGEQASVGDGAQLAEARDHTVVVARSPASHGQVPARHLAEILRALLGP
jgi:hypothetical protein